MQFLNTCREFLQYYKTFQLHLCCEMNRTFLNAQLNNNLNFKGENGFIRNCLFFKIQLTKISYLSNNLSPTGQPLTNLSTNTLQSSCPFPSILKSRNNWLTSALVSESPSVPKICLNSTSAIFPFPSLSRALKASLMSLSASRGVLSFLVLKRVLNLARSTLSFPAKNQKHSERNLIKYQFSGTKDTYQARP